LIPQKGRLIHAYLEKAYNFGFSRRRPQGRYYHGKILIPSLGRPNFSKGAATRRVALRAALRARKMLVWSRKMGSNP